MGTFLLSNRFLNLPHLELNCLHLACLPIAQPACLKLIDTSIV